MLFGFLGVVFIIVVRADDKYEQMVIVALVGLITGAIGYYFGSSTGSTKKDDTTAALGAALATSTPIPPITEPSDAAKALATKLAA